MTAGYSRETAQKMLAQASADLEAIRPQIDTALTSGKEEDGPIVAAWDTALRRFRSACAAYATAIDR